MGEESIAQKPHTRRQGRAEDGRKRMTGGKQRPVTTQRSRGKEKKKQKKEKKISSLVGTNRRSRGAWEEKVQTQF